MAIGERIRYIRKMRGMTQKHLGMSIGFDAKTADVRMAQYESGTRTPKASYTYAIADVLEVSPRALDVPDIGSYDGLAHTLFAIEDIYGLEIGEIDGEICLRLDKTRGVNYMTMHDIFNAWHKKAAGLKRGEISKEEYDSWRYNYPENEQKVIYL